MRHGAEEEDALRDSAKVVDDGRAGAGEAGDAFDEAVQGPQCSAEYIRQREEERDEEPGERGDGRAFSGRQAVFLRDASFFENHACKTRDGHGEDEGEDRASHDEGNGQRQRHHSPADEHDAGKHGVNDFKIHCLIPAFEEGKDVGGLVGFDDDDGPVSGMEGRAAVRDEGFAVTDVRADEAALRKIDVHQAASVERRAFLHDDFDSLDARTFEEADAFDGTASYEGEDFAGSQKPGRKDDVDADLLHEGDVLGADDADDGLAGAEVLGQKRHHHIQAFVACDTDDDIRILNSFLLQKIDVGPVAVKDDALLQAGSDEAAVVPVVIDDFDGNALFFQHRGENLPRAAGPDDESAADAVLVIGGPDILRKLGDSFRISQEIDVIEWQQHVIAVRDDHPVIAENHSDQDSLRQAQILQRDMEKRGTRSQFRFHEAYLAFCEVFDIQCRRRHQDAVDFTRGDELRT